MKPKFEVGDRVYSTDNWAEGHYGTIVSVDDYEENSMPYSVNFDTHSTPSLWKREENLVHVRNHILDCSCEEGDPVYHDREEKWVCSWCEL